MTLLLPYARATATSISRAAPALVVSRLRARYPGQERLALDDVSLTVPVGANVALLGANGAGKSSLLKVVAGLLRPLAGSVHVHGAPTGAQRHRVAYLAQHSTIDWRFPMTAERLVMAGRYPRLGWLRRPGAVDRRAVAEALARVELTALAGRQIGALSGGQRQRLLIARALAQEADLLLLDEPFSAVDAATRAALLAVLAELRRAGATVIMATHDTDQAELRFTDRVRLVEGRIAVEGAARSPGEQP